MTNEKKGLKTSPFDPAEYIGDPKAMQEYLNVTFEEDGDNLKEIGSSLDVIARAWLLTELEHKTKLDRSDLNQILLGAGNPTPEALTKIAEALGLEMPAHFGKTLPLHPQTPKPQTQGRSPKHYPPSPNKITPRTTLMVDSFSTTKCNNKHNKFVEGRLCVFVFLDCYGSLLKKG